jgi:cytochrome c-type biogenesis protein CcsB
LGSILLYITVAFYLVSTLIYVAYLITHRERFVKAGMYLMYGGFGVHTLAIATRWIVAGRTPATNMHESLIFFAWVTIGFFIFLLVKYRVPVLGAFVTPFALFLMIAASFLPGDIVPLSPVLESYWLPFHIFVAFLGNACFAMAFFLGVMYLIQDRYLKKRKVKGLYYLLPSLELIDDLSYRCLSYGFPLLTLGIITGAIWSQHSLGTYWMWKHRQVWSLITWFLYAALLHGRLTSGWRRKKAAMLSIAAFLTLISTFIIINIVLGGAHGYAE